MILEQEKSGEALILRLNRPEALNALSRELLLELEQALATLSVNPPRVLILTGTGRSFCTGADLKERSGMSPPEVRDFLLRVGILFQRIEALSCPVICAINGFAFGGGLELALCADVRLSSSDAQMGLTETSLGIIPGAGGTQRLTRLIGLSKSKLLIFTARKITASEAERLGIIDVVSDNLLPDALALAEEMAKNAPIAVRQAKFAINAAAEADLATGLAVERNAYELTLPTKDRVEALNAFREKRAPKFTGE